MTCLDSQVRAVGPAREPAQLHRALTAVGRGFMQWQARRAIVVLAQVDHDKAERLGLERRELREGVAWTLRQWRR